jgi:hypothetical protein
MEALRQGANLKFLKCNDLFMGGVRSDASRLRRAPP